jgi:copper homeostasis protein
MMNKYLEPKKLEIIAYCIEACQIASSNGADRIELCDNPGDGGTTPSMGMTSLALEISGIPVFPMVRPRGGDFLYSELEFDIMIRDVKTFRELGCKGVVFGLLNADGTVDEDRTRRLVDEARGMEVTFHRAFDRVKDTHIALEAVIRCGCSRILTSGGFPTAPEGMNVIRHLHEQAAGRIIIMPGSGIRSTNISEIISFTGCQEVHSSATAFSLSSMQFLNDRMNEDLKHPVPDPAEIHRMKASISI